MKAKCLKVRLFSLLFFLTISSCISTPEQRIYKMYPGPSLTNNQTALLIAYLPFHPKYVDGKYIKMSVSNKFFELFPGSHKASVEYFGKGFIALSDELEFIAKPGYMYYFRYHILLSEKIRHYILPKIRHYKLWSEESFFWIEGFPLKMDSKDGKRIIYYDVKSNKVKVENSIKVKEYELVWPAYVRWFDSQNRINFIVRGDNNKIILLIDGQESKIYNYTYVGNVGFDEIRNNC